MRRVLLVGSVGAGKTTLAQRFVQDLGPAAKTQAMTVVGDVIDTPGEYLDHGRMNHALLLASYDADVVLLLEDATEPDTHLPPGFASWFTCPVLGAVNKSDQADAQQLQRARQRVLLAGATKVLEVSAATGTGLDQLLAAIEGATR